MFNMISSPNFRAAKRDALVRSVSAIAVAVTVAFAGMPPVLAAQDGISRLIAVTQMKADAAGAEEAQAKESQSTEAMKLQSAEEAQQLELQSRTQEAQNEEMQRKQLQKKMDHANFELKQLMAQEFPQGLSREDAAIHQSLIKETRRLATLTDQLMGELQAGARTSDIGQKLQFQLQEANNIHTRAQKAQSDVTAKYNQTLNGIAQNLKG